jgi:hypothetical protein
MRLMMRSLTLLAVLSLGCGPGGARVVAQQVKFSPIAEGRVQVSGAPGAVVGEGVTTVTLTVVRSQQTSYRLAHLGSHLPVASGYAAVAPDGSFPATPLGAADRPVQSGDELVLTPQAGTAQAGPPMTIPIP